MPLLNPEEIVGSLYVPKGMIVKGSHVSAALARDAAATGGAKFVGHTAMTDIEVKNGGRVTAVLTNNPNMPRIECENVLLAANIWAPALSEKFGMHLPLMAFEHQYVITKPICHRLANFNRSDKDQEVTFPTMRELDSTMYYRQHWQAYGIGSYYHKTAHGAAPGCAKNGHESDFTPEDFFGKPWEQAQRILPIAARRMKTLALRHSSTACLPSRYRRDAHYWRVTSERILDGRCQLDHTRGRGGQISGGVDGLWRI